MTQKAKTGGTPGKAPIGYLNTRQRIEGREIRVVVVDPDKAPHIQWAYEAYATGEWTTLMIAEELAERGIQSSRGAKRGKPLAMSYVCRLLQNRYYLGVVTFNGVEYAGRYQPLITMDTYERVQEVLKAHDQSGERQRVHQHYLKGSLFCGQCGRRLSLTPAKGKYPSLHVPWPPPGLTLPAALPRRGRHRDRRRAVLADGPAGARADRDRQAGPQG